MSGPGRSFGPPVRWRTIAKDVARGALWWASPRGRTADKAAAAACRSPAALLAFSEGLGHGAQQIEEEILPFLEWAGGFCPERICEIGTAAGSTNFLLAHGLPSVKQVIGVDLFVRNGIQLRCLARPDVVIRLVNGSSYAQRTIRKVERIVLPGSLDVLFIDGDHRYSGVQQDFLGYRHLVRDGGLIAFHDIQPDGSERGLVTRQNSGDVPVFWLQLKPLFESKEFVRASDQHGFGIGVIVNSADVTLPEELLVVATSMSTSAARPSAAWRMRASRRFGGRQ